MRIFIQKILVNDISKVHFFRPDRRRSSRSPLSRTWR